MVAARKGKFWRSAKEVLPSVTIESFIDKLMYGDWWCLIADGDGEGTSDDDGDDNDGEDALVGDDR